MVLKRINVDFKGVIRDVQVECDTNYTAGVFYRAVGARNLEKGQKKYTHKLYL